MGRHFAALLLFIRYSKLFHVKRMQTEEAATNLFVDISEVQQVGSTGAQRLQTEEAAINLFIDISEVQQVGSKGAQHP